MSTELDSAKLSDIIKLATQEIISQTEDFIESVSEKSIGTDTVSFMVNGTKTILNRDDYNLLKEKNNAIRLKMKADIKALTAQFKADLKNEANPENEEKMENTETSKENLFKSRGLQFFKRKNKIIPLKMKTDIKLLLNDLEKSPGAGSLIFYMINLSVPVIL